MSTKSYRFGLVGPAGMEVTLCGYEGTKPCKNAGLTLEMFSMIASYFNNTFNYTIQPLNATDIMGTLNYDTKLYNGYLGQLQSGEIDLLIGAFSITEERRHYFHFSLPL
jgi:hypothetical protein